VDRKNQRREFVYDDDGRRTQEKWCTTASGTCTTSRIFTYSYDAANQLTEVNEPDARYTFTYDGAGRVTGVSSLGSNMPQVRLTNTYNAEGSRTNVTDNLSPAGNTTFTYDSDQRMTGIDMKVGSTSGPQIGFEYDDANRMTSISRRACKLCFDAVVTTFSYDNGDRMTAITHTFQPFEFGDPSTLATYSYGYNAASELTTEANQDGTYTYTYDKTGQLTGVDASGGTCGATGCDESFTYDVNGNRTMTGYSTGTGNRLTSDGTFSYTYDDNGSTLTKTRISDGQKFEFAWDYRNRLTQVLLKNSAGTILQQSDYIYDAFNRRIITSFDDDGQGSNSAVATKTSYDAAQPPTAQQIASGTTPLQSDGSYASAIFSANAYSDFDGSGTLTIRYLYGPTVDFIIARRDTSATIAWYLPDHLNTIRDIANTNGTIIDHITFSAYGKVTAETQPSNGDRFKFTGREYDPAVANYYYRARSFDPSAGRFGSWDPVGFSGGDWNGYRYVSNRATEATDPTGLIHITLTICWAFPGSPVPLVSLGLCMAISFPIGGGVPRPSSVYIGAGVFIGKTGLSIDLGVGPGPAALPLPPGAQAIA
jgi:RHS repeat-associated protein